MKKEVDQNVKQKREVLLMWTFLLDGWIMPRNLWEK